jgi:hypothetical protein
MAGKKGKSKAGSGKGQSTGESNRQSSKQAKVSAVDISHQGASSIRDVLKVLSSPQLVETRSMPTQWSCHL